MEYGVNPRENMDDRLGAEALIGGVSPEGMCGSLLTAGVLVGLLATALYFGYLELSKFTGGKLLRLEEVDERLAKRLDRWLPLPERWSVASRVSPLLLWGVSAALFGLSFAGLEREGMRWLAGLVLLVSALLGSIRLAALNEELTGLEKSLKTLKEENRVLQARVESSLSLEELERRATEELGMQRLSPGQIIYIDLG